MSDARPAHSPNRHRSPLPALYYLDHLLELFAFVREHYAHALTTEHEDFLRQFAALPQTAQAMFARLVGRRGTVFAVNRLRYPEIGSGEVVVDALRALKPAGFVSAPQDRHREAVLQALTRDQLLTVLRTRSAGIARSLRKAAYLEMAFEHCSMEDIARAIDTANYVVRRRTGSLDYLAFLYFGSIPNGLGRFTLRDLGLVTTQSLTERYAARFPERDEALENFYFAARARAFEAGTTDQIRGIAQEASSWPTAQFDSSARRRDTLAATVGKWFQARGENDAALSLFEQGESVVCVERRIRLLLTLERRDEALDELNRCLRDPRSDEEFLFAKDIHDRRFANKNISITTDTVRVAETVCIDEAHRHEPENAVLRHFESLGHRAYRAENALWRTLLGLLFWDLLFSPGKGAMPSPFDHFPSVLRNGRLLTEHAPSVEARLALLEDRAATKRALLRQSVANFGARNGVFRWRQSVLDGVFALIEASPTSALRSTLQRLIHDFDEQRHGYPDLMVVDDVGVRFLEVKAEGDQLRRNQLTRMRQLQSAGYRADVLRVQWVIDPEQDYVVVDVETTGGRGTSHRITEIAALKIRGERIVDRFETLLNPQRPIPPGITRLTGITDHMVAEAPCFNEIADSLESFMAGSIFVAHNVRFDYDFVRREFERVGRRFRLPKLCTCASMRRLYPGLKSYGLAALSAQFDVPLTRHHRAMPDAEAAAGLLLLINEARREQIA